MIQKIPPSGRTGWLSVKQRFERNEKRTVSPKAVKAIGKFEFTNYTLIVTIREEPVNVAFTL